MKLFHRQDALAVEETVVCLFLLLFLMLFKFSPSKPFRLENHACCIGSSSWKTPQGAPEISFFILATGEVGQISNKMHGDILFPKSS